MRHHLIRSLLGIALLFPSLAAAAADTTPPGTLVIIGATARTSKELIPQALERGYAVIALARKPDDVATKHPRLTVARGDVYDLASLEAALTGPEVVISMVGPRVDPFSEVPPMDLFTTGTGNIIKAMQNKGNRRLLVASSIGVENEFPAVKPDQMKEPGKMWLWNSRHLYKDMRDMETLVRRSGLDYVIFRPGFMVEEPARRDLRFAVNENSPKQRMLTYADFAAFVLDQVRGNDYLGTTVGVYTDRVLEFGRNADFDKLSKQMQEKARENQ